MALFGKKKVSSGPSRPQTPVEEIKKLRQQGLSNNQIVQTLQREGFKTYQIFDAMNQADQMTAGPIDQQVPTGEGLSPNYSDEIEQPTADNLGMPPEPRPAPPIPARESAPEPSFSEEKIEEIAEAIIDEKWKELMEHVEKIVSWKNRTEQRIVAVESRFEDLKKTIDAMQAGLVGKIKEYDKNVTDVSTELKAMEKVFQKVIPKFTENVNELSRITKNIKPSRKK